MKLICSGFVPILIFVFAMFFARSGCAQDSGAPKFAIEIDRDTIFEGDCFLYTVSVNNMDINAVPDFRQLETDFQVSLRDRHAVSSSITRKDSFGIERLELSTGIKYRYELTPKKTGKLTVPPPKLIFNGDPFPPSSIRIAQNPVMKHLEPVQNATVELTVIPQDQQDIVYIELSTDKDAYYPLQPITVGVNVYLKGFPGAFSKEDPLIIQNTSGAIPARITVPWLDESLLPPGLQPQIPIESWINPYVSQKKLGGFFINRFRGRSFFQENESDYIYFRPPSEKVMRADKNGKDTEYWKFTFSRQYLADRIGKLELGECSFQGVLPVFDPENTDKVIPFNAFVKSTPLKIEIKDVPEEGRPETFLGAFGVFNWAAEMLDTEGRLGDPLTLRLRVSGRGTLKNLKPPALDKIEAIAENFKPYPPSEEFSQRGNAIACTFTYSIRPQKEGGQEFPGIPFTYFDVDKEEFVTLMSEPISLRIFPAEPLKSAPAANLKGEGGELHLYKDGIFANMVDASGVRDQWLDPYSRFALFAGLLVAYPVVALLVFIFRRLRTESELTRRRNAFSKAKSLWKEGSHLVDQGATESGFSKFYSSIASLISDMTGAPEAALASNDIIRILEANEVPRNTVDYVRKLLDTFEAVRFGDIPNVHSKESIVRASYTVIETLNKHFRKHNKRRANHNPLGAAMLFFCILMLIPGCSRPPSPEAVALFEQAQELFEQAGSEETKEAEEMYHELARKYQELIDSGIRSGPVYYNQGNAWFRAGEKGRALASYRAAQRYLPRNPYLTANILAVLGTESDPSFSGWTRYCFFWQDWIAYANKLRLLSFGAGLSFVLGTVWLFYPSRWVRRSGLCLFFGTLLVCGSAVYDWYRFDHLRHGVTITAETVLRKGNAEHYEPVFTEKLPEATEFTILEQRGQWLQCRLNNGQIGWLPENETVEY